MRKPSMHDYPEGDHGDFQYRRDLKAYEKENSRILLNGSIKSFEVKSNDGLGDKKLFTIEFSGYTDKETAERIIEEFKLNRSGTCNTEILIDGTYVIKLTK